MAKIYFPSWVAVSKEHAMKVAREQRAMEKLSIDHRLMLLAYGRMNAAGHATFEAPRGEPDKSELRKLLGHVDKKTGEIVLCSRQTIYNAKHKLADAGLLVEASGGLVCVWVTVEHATYANGGVAICPFHRYRVAEQGEYPRESAA